VVSDYFSFLFGFKFLRCLFAYWFSISVTCSVSYRNGHLQFPVALSHLRISVYTEHIRRSPLFFVFYFFVLYNDQQMHN
jgi:hypothetical protein